MESLDMLANNLANAGSAGYKKDTEFYSLYLSEAAAAEAADADPVTAMLPVIDRQWTDFSQGVIQSTGNPLDAAIDGEGFLAVDGPGGTMYTRSGRLRISAQGRLETPDGYPLRLSGGSGLTVNPARPIEISAAGDVTQAGQFLGRLELAGFSDPSRLSKAGRNYFVSPVPGQASAAQLIQGRVEGSNVNTAESAVRLVSVMRQFEMLNKAASIGSEMNRRAVEEVARVGA